MSNTIDGVIQEMANFYEQGEMPDLDQIDSWRSRLDEAVYGPEGDRTKAHVLLVSPDSLERSTLDPDDYIVLAGPQRYVDHIQDYPVKGTTVLTIKRSAA
jgi:hypothetical protein